MAALYAGYVRDSLATFELAALTPDDRRARLEELNRAGVAGPGGQPGRGAGGVRLCGVLATPDGVPLHRGGLPPASTPGTPARPTAGGSRRLMGDPLSRARDWGAKEAIAVIVDSGEPACLALDGSSGFVEVGRLRRVGFKLGRWVETVLLQLSLEDPPAQAPGSRVPT